MTAPDRISLLPSDGWSWMAGSSPHEADAVEYVRADLTPTPLAEALAVPTEEPEAGEERAVIVRAKWKPCVHDGGWWVAQDADGHDVLLAPDGFAALRAIGERADG